MLPCPVPSQSAAEAGAGGAEEDEQRRCDRMRRLIREEGDSAPTASPGTRTPGTIVQFWDDSESVPVDVAACLDTWAALERSGFRRVLYDDRSARRFIAERLSVRHVSAFDRCRHPAMRSDYFRLCYLLSLGGAYVDADDAYTGADPAALFVDGLIRLQPMCHDPTTGEMVGPDEFLGETQPSPDWIYYVNNNPIIAPAGHPVLLAALARATRLLLDGLDRRLGVQSTAGPGNLTAVLVAHVNAQDARQTGRDFALLPRWERVAVSMWPLGYRSDSRNWRLWDPSA